MSAWTEKPLAVPFSPFPHPLSGLAAQEKQLPSNLSLPLLGCWALVCVGRVLRFLPKMPASVLCWPGRGNKLEMVGPPQKPEGFLPPHITVWRLSIMQLKMTKLISLGCFLRMLPSLRWRQSRGFVSFMH